MLKKRITKSTHKGGKTSKKKQMQKPSLEAQTQQNEKSNHQNQDYSDIILQRLGFMEERLKEIISALDPRADFKEHDGDQCISLIAKDRIEGILALEEEIDENLLNCLSSISRISHILKGKALRFGGFMI